MRPRASATARHGRRDHRDMALIRLAPASGPIPHAIWKRQGRGAQIIALGVAYFVAVTALDVVTNVGAIDDLTSTASCWCRPRPAAAFWIVQGTLPYPQPDPPRRRHARPARARPLGAARPALLAGGAAPRASSQAGPPCRAAHAELPVTLSAEADKRVQSGRQRACPPWRACALRAPALPCPARHAAVPRPARAGAAGRGP